MPRQDGTGPMGQGPMSGRGLGYCGVGFNRGCCFGRGLGFGRRWTTVDEKTALDEEEKILEEELSAVREEKKRLAKK